MDIKLLKCRDEDNAFPKRLYEGITVSGTLKGECDLLAPIITFGGSNAFSNLKYFNYAYIPDYERYYFISELNLVANGLIECSMVVDVLESWKDKILQLECVVARNEFEKDPYIIDDLVIMTPTKNELYVSPNEERFPDFVVNDKNNTLDFIIHTASDKPYRGDNEFTYKMPFMGTGGEYHLIYRYGLKQLFNKFWNVGFLEGLFANYTDKANMVTSLRAYPFDVRSLGINLTRPWEANEDPDNPSSVTAAPAVYFGTEWITLDDDTNIYTITSNGEKTFTFGETDFDGFLTNSYMDYATISEYKLYLPFIGVVDIDGKYIYHNKTLTIKYYFDVPTGIMNVLVTSGGDNVVGIYKNKVGVDCLVSGGDTGVIRDKILGLVGTAAGIAASFVNPALGVAVGATTTLVNQDAKSTVRNEATGRQVTAGTTQRTTSVNGTSRTTTKQKPSVAGSAVELVSGLSSIANARIPFSINAPQGDTASFMYTWLHPVIIIRRPEQKYYTNYGHYVGYPLYKTKILANCTGYTKIQDVHVDIPCTNTERQLISEALKAGVILNSAIDPEPEPEVKPDTPPTPETPSLSEPPTMFASPFIGQFEVTSPYGMRILNGEQEFHKGIDLVGIDTDRVTSIGSGVVDAVGWENPDNHNQGFGYRVRILNADKTYTYYGHLQENSSPLVVGQSINEFDLIGIMGATGAVTGRHTCLSIRPISGGSIDPSIVTGIPNALGTYKFVRS